jgi:hypothetical protein
MDLTALYEEDFHAWSLHQAQVLRRLAAAGLPLPNDLDLEHVAEEIEDLGSEQRFAVESNLLQALAHLIKLVALPADQAVPHWTKEADAFLLNASRRWRPSMRRAIDEAVLWDDACRLATRALAADGLPVPVLPRESPLSIEDLVLRGADPVDLAGRLAAAMAKGNPVG